MLTSIINFLVFMTIWAIGCYLVEEYIKSIPVVMMLGYLVANIGLFAGDFIEKIFIKITYSTKAYIVAIIISLLVWYGVFVFVKWLLFG